MAYQNNFSVENLPVIDHNVDWSKFDYPIGAFTGPTPWNKNTSSYSDKEGSWNYGPVFGEEKCDIVGFETTVTN